jgi:nickel-dependent lactate racemase
MAEINLGYGEESLTLEYDDRRFRVLTSTDSAAERPLSDAEIGAALDEPIESAPLDEIVATGDTVLIVVSDATRESGSAQIVQLLVRRLIAAGVAPFDIRIIFATGIHRAVTAEEKSALLTPFITQRIKTLDHDAYDPAGLVNLGSTERGVPVQVNRALREHTHVILTGAVGFHYFAGFTGGRKSICPGLASAATVEATHLLALDFEQGGRRAGVGTGLLEGNAVHKECERVAALVAPSFLVNSVVNERGLVVRLFAGDWRAAHRRACDEYASTHSIKIDGRREMVVAGCGGTPYDLNVIQAHKALDMAALACSDGGTIVLVAKCSEGLGRDDFLKWFEAENSRALEERLHDSYKVNGQTAWALLTKAERFRIILVSGLENEVVRSMRMTPARTLEEAMANYDTGGNGYIMPRGAALLPVV